MEKTYRPLMNLDQDFELLPRTVGNYIRVKTAYLKNPLAPDWARDAVKSELGKSLIEVPERTDIATFYQDMGDVLFGAHFITASDGNVNNIRMEVIDEAFLDFLHITTDQKKQAFQ